MLKDILFDVDDPPTQEELRGVLDSLVPSTPGKGVVLQTACATMLEATSAFRKAKTLSSFEAALRGSHSRYPCFIVAVEPTAIVVYRNDPGSWQASPERRQMRDPTRSEYWRHVVVKQLQACCDDMAAQERARQQVGAAARRRAGVR